MDSLPSLSNLSRLRDVLEAMQDFEPKNQLEARAVLEQIRLEKGYLDDEMVQDVSKMPTRTREFVQQLVQNYRNTQGEYTTNITDQLYSTKSRFFHELIQNADDSTYEKAGSEPPAITFEITPEHFRVETNEDGFTRSNIVAICRTGKSSKRSPLDNNTIGEKGFGFKSVFVVANRVEIQSGFWSFAFEHEKGEDGLGMVTPIDAEPVRLDSNIRTRITLSFNHHYRSEAAHNRLLDDLESLPSTIILFLQKLRKLTIQVRCPGRAHKTITLEKKEVSSDASDMVQLKRTIAVDDEQVNDGVFEEELYIIKSEIVKNMPADDMRENVRPPEVILAFPVDSSARRPEISSSGREIFAFLPLRSFSSLKFLIQSDFVTVASREDVLDRPWNETLRDRIADVFVSAMVEFCQTGHALEYSWPKYVPDLPLEGLFWKPLSQRIMKLLGKTPILRSWTSRKLQIPADLRIVPTSFIHKGTPLLDDLRLEIYLAPEYGVEDQKVLKRLGVDILHWEQLMARIEADLKRGPSKIRTVDPDDTWHSSFASQLLAAFEEGLKGLEARLLSMAIIPLDSGKWVAASSSVNPVYFPTIEGVRIPDGTSLALLDPKAAAMPQRAELYRNLGVGYCITDDVCLDIISYHKKLATGLVNATTTQRLTAQLRFLYTFYKQHPNSLKPTLRIPTEAGTVKYASDKIYFLSDNPYHTQKLLGPGCELNKDGPVYFLSSDLQFSEPSRSRCHSWSWIEWLQIATTATYYPPLTNETTKKQLSSVMLRILERNSKAFLGALQTHWANDYESVAALNPWVLTKLKETEVMCESGKRQEFQTTYLPVRELQDEIEELGIQLDFPFLQLPEPLDATKSRKWDFLEDLGVRKQKDCQFYLDVLEILNEKEQRLGLDKAKGIYLNIAQLTQLGSNDVLRFFDDHPAIYVESSSSFQWHTLEECVWEAPDFLTVKTPIKKCYQQHNESQIMFKFFTTYLEIADATIGDVLDELLALKASSNIESEKKLDLATRIYQHLNGKEYEGEDWGKVRRRFHVEKLILGQVTWRSPEECVWNSPYAMTNVEVVGHLYPDLMRFFKGRLGVQVATASMMIKELCKLVTGKNITVGKVKEALLKIGRFVAKEDHDEQMDHALQELKLLPFIPVIAAQGACSLARPTDAFMINDHDRYFRAFSGQVDFVDLSQDDSQSLSMMFNLLGIESKYLSNSVREESAIGNDVKEDDLLTDELRTKAYALFCCAASFKSLKALHGDRFLFESLCQLRLYLTDDISSVLVLQQERTLLKVPSERVYVHLTVEDGGIKLYLPRDNRQRRRCEISQMPKIFCQILGIEDPAATHSVSQILDCKRSQLQDLMEIIDISTVSWIAIPADMKSSEAEGSSLLESVSPSVPATFSPSEMPATGTTLYPRHTGDVDNYVPEEPAVLQRSPTPSAIPVPLQHSSEVIDNYRQLLHLVIQKARHGQSNLNAGTFDMTALGDSLPHEDGSINPSFDNDTTFGRRELNPLAHDRKIGAAGELFVFETLKKHISKFALEHWQSRIRGEVGIHADYANLRPWDRPETADCVYTDSTGRLWRFLKDNGFGGLPVGLDDEAKFGAARFQPLEYFIEVKTTTKECGTRFFMSKGQRKRMEAMRVSASAVPKQVYVIFRVYELTSNDIGVKIFVDPCRFVNNVLQFEVDGWTVAFDADKAVPQIGLTPPGASDPPHSDGAGSTSTAQNIFGLPVPFQAAASVNGVPASSGDGAFRFELPAGGTLGGTNVGSSVQRPTSAGGLFGGTNNGLFHQSPAPTGGLFGGTNVGSSFQRPMSTGGLFSGTNSGSFGQSPAPAGGPFGATNTGLFGQSPAPAGGPFGATNTGLFGQSPAPAGGPFGATNTGLFGQSPAPTGGPFGATNSGIFGQSPAPTGGLFGGMNVGSSFQRPASTGGLFAGTTFGGYGQSSVPAAPVAMPTASAKQNLSVPGTKESTFSRFVAPQQPGDKFPLR